MPSSILLPSIGDLFFHELIAIDGCSLYLLRHHFLLFLCFLFFFSFFFSQHDSIGVLNVFLISHRQLLIFVFSFSLPSSLPPTILLLFLHHLFLLPLYSFFSSPIHPPPPTHPPLHCHLLIDIAITSSYLNHRCLLMLSLYMVS